MMRLPPWPTSFGSAEVVRKDSPGEDWLQAENQFEESDVLLVFAGT